MGMKAVYIRGVGVLYITGSKKDGGLGFKDFTHLNSSIFAKQAGRLIRNPDAFWVKIREAIYFPNIVYF